MVPWRAILATAPGRQLKAMRNPTNRRRARVAAIEAEARGHRRRRGRHTGRREARTRSTGRYRGKLVALAGRRAAIATARDTRTRRETRALPARRRRLRCNEADSRPANSCCPTCSTAARHSDHARDLGSTVRATDRAASGGPSASPVIAWCRSRRDDGSEMLVDRSTAFVDLRDGESCRARGRRRLEARLRARNAARARPGATECATRSRARAARRLRVSGRCCIACCCSNPTIPEAATAACGAPRVVEDAAATRALSARAPGAEDAAQSQRWSPRCASRSRDQ